MANVQNVAGLRYVPFMRVLEGDMNGLRYASSSAHSKTRPYFEIVKSRPRKSDRSTDFVARAADLIVSTWRLKGPSFVELFDQPGPEESNWFPSNEHTLVLLHRYLRQKGVAAIPAIALDRSGDYREAFMEVARSASAGIAVRLYPDDLELPSVTVDSLRRLSSEARRANADIDLLINLQRIRPDQLNELKSRVLDFLTAIDSQPKFRSITLIGTSVPEGLSGIVPEGESREVLRLELKLWREICQARGSLIGLGDYGIIRPEYDDRIQGFANINAKILYTSDNATHVVRGKSRKKEKLEDQYPELAVRLTKSTVFRGAKFSWGDARIAEYARYGEAPGTPQTWVVICTCHHIELVAAQFHEEFALIA